MTDPRMLKDPGSCPHDRVRRIGIQKSPRRDWRLYLVTCVLCETTLTTRTLRERREGKGRRLAG
ncbi:MAG: hypothetical protein HUU06_08705 [Planctomycetaceae bacterium]|nr:hypothetical protein [Planctomycetota bacterium]NUN52848.1 hypothetical protein [Planctomycetaceae bacterium]